MKDKYCSDNISVCSNKESNLDKIVVDDLDGRWNIERYNKLCEILSNDAANAKNILCSIDIVNILAFTGNLNIIESEVTDTYIGTFNDIDVYLDTESKNEYYYFDDNDQYKKRIVIL